MTKHPQPSEQTLDRKEGHDPLSAGQRAFGQRPDGGSARTVEPVSEAYFPTAAVDMGKDNDRVLRLALEPAMTHEGFADLPDEDDMRDDGLV